MKSYCVSGFTVVILALSSIPAMAQPVISAKSGLISYAEGNVALNGEKVDSSVTHFQDVKENAIVSTSDGRAEVLLTPGVTLRLGENSSLRMITNRLIDTRVEVLTGSAVVEADEIMKDTSVTVVCKTGTATLSRAGIYRFDTEPAEVKVFKGMASVAVNGETTPVASGRMLSLGSDVASVQKFDENDTDTLDRWSHRRGGYQAMANASAANALVGSGSMPTTWGMNGCAPAWGFNQWYGMMTYIPCNGMLMSPYGYQFWSPFAINRAFWYGGSGFFGGGGFRQPGGSGFNAGLGSGGGLTRPAASAALARGSSSAISSAAAVGASHGALGGGAFHGGGFNGSAASSAGGFSGGGASGVGGGGMGGGGGAAAGGGHSGGAASAGGGHR